MSKNLSQNCCNRKKDYNNSSRLESKDYGEKYNAKIARSPGQKSQFSPYYRYRYTRNGKAR